MNKMRTALLTGLMFCITQNTLPVGEEQREILYTLHSLGQDFSKVPMITENIAMFTGIIEMNIKMTETKLAKMQTKLNSTLIKSVAAIGGIALTHDFFGSIITNEKVSDMLLGFGAMRLVMQRFSSYLGSAGVVCAALNMYDAFKNKNVLIESLALDREILGQLQDIQESAEQNSALEGTNLLESALESEPKN